MNTALAPLQPDATEPIPHAPATLTLSERRAAGRARRRDTPRSTHAGWWPPADRADPVTLLEQSNQTRIPELVPIRYGRMLASPFTFLRGSPIVMAHDLAGTPRTGINVQVSGDAHLMNFGVYATPERNLLFDLNDFDETLVGPWEWDVKRLAASLVVAGRSHGIKGSACQEAARRCVRSYREHVRQYSEMPLLDVWYSRVDAEAALQVFRKTEGAIGPLDLEHARRRNSLQALGKLVSSNGQVRRIVDNPPLVCHVPEDALKESLQRAMPAYFASLQDDRRALVQRYHLVDFALKVVGVGSVGTRCYILLLEADHGDDVLFLQIKEAQASVLEPHVGPSPFDNHGHRVATGQRMMQSASDMFLGWTSDGQHDYYVRQLRDMKGTANLLAMGGPDLIDYAGLCGWVLARAHARSGDAAMIAGYLGKSAIFDKAIATFATAYADQTEQDYEALKTAVKSGRVHAEMGV
jgi:uncharacterized protein (DUF2252 family)